MKLFWVTKIIFKKTKMKANTIKKKSNQKKWECRTASLHCRSEDGLQPRRALAGWTPAALWPRPAVTPVFTAWPGRRATEQCRKCNGTAVPCWHLDLMGQWSAGLKTRSTACGTRLRSSQHNKPRDVQNKEHLKKAMKKLTAHPPQRSCFVIL